MSYKILRWSISLILGLVLGMGRASSAHAAAFTVNSTADAVDTNPGNGVCATATGECTLRAAIIEANALPGDDTITLPAGIYTLSISGIGEDAAASGDLDIMSNFTINGAGANTTILDANGIDRVLNIIGFVAVNISNVSIRGGNPGGFVGGGGILNISGTVTLSNSIISENSAHGGGGLFNLFDGVLTVTDSHIFNNSAPVGSGILNVGTMIIKNTIINENNSGLGIGNGAVDNGIGMTPHGEAGGILTISTSSIFSNQGGGITNASTLTIINSTISGNTGPGLNIGGNPTFTKVEISNSTISHNSTPLFGGGISAGTGTVNLNSVTITDNISDSDNNGFGDGGGLHLVGDAILNLRNTIIAGNTDNGGQAPDCFGSPESGGHNILGTTSGCSFIPITGDLTNVDPSLGPLQNNGGPTSTHALLPDSPAIDAGNPAGCTDQNGNLLTIDQRGVARPQGTRCDIGAFELEAGGGVEEVTIDIKPGSQTNPINPQSRGKIPVAILSTPDFNAPAMVNKTSLTFGRTGEEQSLAFCNNKGEDVNSDGLLDLVCHFKTRLTGFQVGDLEGILKGQTVEGLPIEGHDAIRIIK